MVNYSKRYVKFKFEGYIPVDLAIQAHMIAKDVKKNEVGGDLYPYTEYEGEYDRLTKNSVKEE